MKCWCGGLPSGRPTRWISGNLPHAVELESRGPQLELLDDDASGLAFVLEDELSVVLKHHFALKGGAGGRGLQRRSSC